MEIINEYDESDSDVCNEINNAIENESKDFDKQVIVSKSIHIHTLVYTELGLLICEAIDSSYVNSRQIWFSGGLTVRTKKDFQNGDVFEIRIVDFKLKSNPKNPNERLFVIKDYVFINARRREEFDFIKNINDSKACNKAIERQTKRTQILKFANQKFNEHKPCLNWLQLAKDHDKYRRNRWSKHMGSAIKGTYHSKSGGQSRYYVNKQRRSGFYLHIDLKDKSTGTKLRVEAFDSKAKELDLLLNATKVGKELIISKFNCFDSEIWDTTEKIYKKTVKVRLNSMSIVSFTEDKQSVKVITTRKELIGLNFNENSIVFYQFCGTLGPQSDEDFSPVLNFWVLYLRETRTNRNIGYLLVEKRTQNLDSLELLMNREVVISELRLGLFGNENVLIFSQQSIIKVNENQLLVPEE